MGILEYKPARPEREMAPTTTNIETLPTVTFRRSFIKNLTRKKIMPKTIINTDKAPGAIGPYSQAVVTGNLLFTSGQLPIDPATGKISKDSIEAHAHQVFKNLTAIAKEAGTDLGRAVKITVYLADINDFSAVNTVYAEYFKSPFPARSAFQVAALPLGADIEVEAVIEV
jgi:2-iminobutanoate/2-iminopropanoate deaminase